MAAAALAACVVGACLQRVSGAGVGLVVTPVMVLIFGPVAGVLLTNATTVVSAALIMSVVWRNIDWRRFGLIAPIGLMGSVAGALLVGALPAAVLQVVVGAVVLLALVMTFALPRTPHLTGPVPALGAGTLGGFLNTVAGVAMPAMVIYATVSRWEQVRFAATLQPVFLSFGAMSVATKLGLGTAAVAELPPLWFIGLLAVGIGLGVALGGVLARRVSAVRARWVAVVLAGVGAALTVVRGLTA